jgi:CheY-like chemotaxis protein
MNGIELAQTIRSHQRFAHIPIVLVSAHQSLDFITPVIDKISLVQAGGFAADRLATFIEALM